MQKECLNLNFLRKRNSVDKGRDVCPQAGFKEKKGNPAGTTTLPAITLSCEDQKPLDLEGNKIAVSDPKIVSNGPTEFTKSSTD